MTDRVIDNNNNVHSRIRNPSFSSRVKSLLKTFINHSNISNDLQRSNSVTNNFKYYIQIEPVLNYLQKIEELTKKTQKQYNFSKDVEEVKKTKIQISLERIDEVRLQLKYCTPRMTNFDFDNYSLTVFVGKYINNICNLVSMMECPVINNRCTVYLSKREYANLQELNALGKFLFKIEIDLPDLSHYSLSGDYNPYLITEDSHINDLDLNLSVESRINNASAPFLEPPSYDESQT